MPSGGDRVSTCSTRPPPVKATPRKRTTLKHVEISPDAVSSCSESDSSGSFIYGTSDDESDSSDDSQDSNHNSPPGLGLDVEGDLVSELTEQWTLGSMAESSLGEYARAHKAMVKWYVLLI